jgi:hypothetical protein
MTDFIALALSAIRDSTESDDVTLHRKLVVEGLTRSLAARLVEFLPMAYCRLMLEPSGVHFSNSFQRRLTDGQVTPEQPLSSQPIWNEVLAFAKSEIDHGISPEDLLAVAGRCAEFDAVNQLLNRRSKMKDIHLTPVVLLWPEQGPDP